MIKQYHYNEKVPLESWRSLFWNDLRLWEMLLLLHFLCSVWEGDNRLYCSLLNTDSTSLLSRYSTGQRSRHRLFVCWKHCLHGKFSTVEPSLKGHTCGLYLPSYARLSTLKWDTPCLYGLSDSLKFRLPIEKYVRHTKLLSLFFFFFFSQYVVVTVCLKAGLETTAWTKVSRLWNHFFLHGR